jgi:hypothetical protein
MTFNITFSTVRLTLRYDKTDLATGTGFLYRRQGKHYLITAWHNLSGRHSETLKPLHKMGALPNNMLVDMPQVYQFPHTHPMYARMPVRFSFDDGEQTVYKVHSQTWPRVDVAVIPFDPSSDYLHETYLSTGETREFFKPLSWTQPDGSMIDIVALSDSDVSVELSADLLTHKIEHTVGDDLFLLGFPEGVTDLHPSTDLETSHNRHRAQTRLEQAKTVSGGLGLKKGDVGRPCSLLQ